MNPTEHEAGRSQIAIVDPCSAAGYDLHNIATGGLGSTEATILRIAAALAV